MSEIKIGPKVMILGIVCTVALTIVAVVALGYPEVATKLIELIPGMTP